MMNNTTSRLSFAPPRYQYEDYKRWDENWELIDGYAYSLLPSPVLKHQLFIGNCIRGFGNQLFGENTGCHLISRLDWIVNNETVVRPDILITNKKIETDYLMFPPVFILEVLASSTEFIDRNVKFELYEMNGVKYYLMADTNNKKTECYELINGNYQPISNTVFKLTETFEVTLNMKEFFWVMCTRLNFFPYKK